MSKKQCIINNLQRLIILGVKFIAQLNLLINHKMILKKKFREKDCNVDKKILDTSGSVKKIDFNTRIKEIEKKIPDTSQLVKLVLMQRL